MSIATMNPNDFTALQLKEILKAKGLSTLGLKQEMITRLMSSDPSGAWMSEYASSGGRVAVREDSSASTAPSADSPRPPSPEAGENNTRHVDILLKEKELAEREVQLLRRELEWMRGMQRLTTEGSPQASDHHSIVAINESVKSMLNYFDGSGEDFDVWKKQLMLLRSTYKLNDNAAKLLVVSRLKKKALEWFHSRPEHIEMPVDDLLKELCDMFDNRQSRITARREFENRAWKKEESFAEYFHAKSILANRVSIDEEELIEYLIDGIPDHNLRNHARLQRFKSKALLLDAFKEVTLSPSTSRGAKANTDSNEQLWRRTQRTDGAALREDEKMWRGYQGPRRTEDERRRSNNEHERRRSNNEHYRRDDRQDHGYQTRGVISGRCYNCGGRDHFFFDCPVKNKGSKCFGCGEFGHLSMNCPKKKAPATGETLIVRRTCEKYLKRVFICEREVTALIDTGSDLCLMRKDDYDKLRPHVPPLKQTHVYFRGIGSNMNQTIGEFETDTIIDGDCFTILIRVVSDKLMTHSLLIGTDFLDKIELIVKQGQITIQKAKSGNNLHGTDFDLEREVASVDLSYVQDVRYRDALSDLINNYQPNKTRETEVEMNIILKDDEPVFQRARRLSPSERDTVNEQIQKWLHDKIIQPSLSDYASPIVLVKKKNGATRLCVDYRLLNKKIIKDRYPLPLIEDQIDLLQSAKIYSTLDLENGFFHVKVNKQSRKYTAFIVPDGQYEFLRVPFGLCNSPAVFQRFINAVFKELIRDKTILLYLDDLIIPSKDRESGLERLKIVLRVASEAGLLINWGKCKFLQPSVEYLGHIVEDGTVRPSEYKNEAVTRFPTPENFKQVQSFLGLTGYFRKFIAHYSLIARPLTNLLKADTKFRFDSEEQHAFEQLKIALSSRPVLKLYKIGAETELHTDASKFGYGAILLQRDDRDNMLHPVYFASGKTTPTEERYSSYELEVLAIVKSLKKFRVYLLGTPFKIITDCQAFALTMRKKDLCVRVARWALLLEEFQYTIEHRPGRNLLHVDALSRNPLPSCMLIGESDDSVSSRLKKAQRKDADLLKMLDLVESGQAEGYVIRGGVLFKEVDNDIRFVVPKTMQTLIIRRAHENGHFSSEKTEAIIKRDYWFRKMREKVDRVLRNCIDCILAEKKQGKAEGHLFAIDKGEVPLDTYHVDHLGPLPSTKKRYRYILVVIDTFSKFVWLYATRTCNSVEVIERLKKQSILFGNPRRIISDRGTAFTSTDFEAYCKDEHVEHVLTTVGMPRANGQVERVNRTLIPLLTKLSAPKPGEWHKYVDRCQKCFNIIPSRSTKISPFKILFGIEPRFRSDPQIVELLEREWTDVFQKNRNELREEARRNILKIQQENRRNFNKKRVESRKYREGDLVAIKRTQQGPGLKIAAKYLGPYEIIRVLRNDRYIMVKVGDHEGPQQTSTAAEFIKPWINEDSDDLYSNSEEMNETKQ
ncbi:Transposon Tf2-6 polyprotein [Anthophora quadrimaculata]